MRTIKGLIVVLALILAPAVNLHAKDTALLIGLNYANAPKFDPSERPLPGINLDVQYMESIAKTMGFEDVRVLWNEQATYMGIRKAFQDLVAQTKENDRILIYYSGHGGQLPDENGDEADGLDEALVPFDAMEGRALVDDQLGAWLDQIPSDRILVIIDACHSGTGTRAAGLGSDPSVRTKYIQLSTKVTQATASQKVEYLEDFLPKGDHRSKFVSIMAARDRETAGATSQGSRFTVVFKQSFDKAVATRTCKIELGKLFAEVQDAVSRSTSASSSPQTPQFEADDPVLKNQPLLLKGIAGCNEAPVHSGRMQYWSDFAAQATGNLSLRANASTVPVHANPNAADRCSAKQGLLVVEVTVPRDGYLTILNVGEGESTATVLFPNQYAQDNHVRQGQTLQIPAPGGSWCLPARLPQGLNSQDVLLLGVFTDHYVNLFANGKGSGPFREVPNNSRSFAAEPGKAESLVYTAGQLMIKITR